MKILRKILIGLSLLLIAIQFVRPGKNLSADVSKDFSTKYQVSEDVKAILQRACNDCHSNTTVYPWYAEIQPVGWWLNNHVREGKQHFNINNFASYPAAVQKKKMEDCIEVLQKDEMPLSSYTLIHRNAILNEEEKQKIIHWCNATIDTLKAIYPADSLVLKRQKWD
jgi:hypothetical protein